MEVVDNFPHQAIRDYYHKWYRPDLQGIIVVGNIDVDKVEARIKELWKDVPAPVDAAVREYVQVPDNDAPIVAVVSDKEALSNSLRIAFKQPVDTTSKMTVEATRKDLVRSLVSMMFATRCSELSQLENPPFIMLPVLMAIISIPLHVKLIRWWPFSKPGSGNKLLKDW